MRKKQKPYTITSKNRSISLFEKKVYKAVSTIPSGETRSYKWVAEKIGKPLASRAVGNALNKNPYPGIVPCHRVIRSDGTIGGFARGTKAKKSLLLDETAEV
ncbi:MAG: MGMT family protein [Candidatus Omnitrophota bacterium]